MTETDASESRPPLDLEALSLQLDSENSRDRLLALVALKDATPEEALPLIKKVIDDDSVQIRGMAVFALGIKPLPECFGLVLKVLESDNDYNVRAAAAGALGYLEDPRAVEPLMHAFYEDTEWLVQFSAAVALGNLKDKRAREVLLKALDNEQVLYQQAAISAFGEIGDLEAVDDILRFADSEDWLVRQRLAEALGNLPCDKSQSALRYLMKDAHPQVKEAADLSLQRLLA